MRLFSDSVRARMDAEERILEACELVHDYTTMHAGVAEIEKGAVAHLARVLSLFRNELDEEQLEIMRALRRHAKIGGIKGHVAKRVGRMVLRIEHIINVE